jgi:hypothetical protein
MRSHPRPCFAQVPLKKIKHLIAEKDAVVSAPKVTREKGIKNEPYNDPAQNCAPAGFWGSFHT